MRRIRIATRASKLALAQACQVRDLLVRICPEWQFSVVTAATKGDLDKHDFLYESGSIGLFTSEIERMVSDGNAEIAVHSIKDLPTRLAEGLVIAAVPKRDTAADALVAHNGVKSIEQLPVGATVGTSSLRRIGQIRHIKKDIVCVPLRGNVETRIQKVRSGMVDAIVVAAAGLNRLDLAGEISAVLDPREFLPAPGQGALAVQVKADDKELVEIVSLINDRESRIVVEAERAVLKAIHGGCSIPLGVYSQILDGDKITISGLLCDIQGQKHIRYSLTGPVTESVLLAGQLADELLRAGGRQILQSIRQGGAGPVNG